MTFARMDQALREHIGEMYAGGCWEAITGVLWEKGDPWQLFKFEHDVEYAGKQYRCVIIQKIVYYVDDIDAVDCAEDVFSSSWEI